MPVLRETPYVDEYATPPGPIVVIGVLIAIVVTIFMIYFSVQKEIRQAQDDREYIGACIERYSPALCKEFIRYNRRDLGLK